MRLAQIESSSNTQTKQVDNLKLTAKPPVSLPSEKQQSSGNHSSAKSAAQQQTNASTTSFQLMSKNEKDVNKSREKPNSFSRALGRILSGVRSSSKDATNDSSMGTHPINLHMF